MNVNIRIERALHGFASFTIAFRIDLNATRLKFNPYNNVGVMLLELKHNIKLLALTCLILI